MASEFYATLAHMLPILLLAWLALAYLERLWRQQRQVERTDREAGVLFWTKPRMPDYALFVTEETVVSTTIPILVLAKLTIGTMTSAIAPTTGTQRA